MLLNGRQWRSVTVALIIGLTFPFAWMVVTGEGRTSDKHTVERSVADRMTPSEYEAFMREHSRPMTFPERLSASAHIAKKEWQGYLGVSAIVALLVFLVNGFVWKSDSRKP